MAQRHVFEDHYRTPDHCKHCGWHRDHAIHEQKDEALAAKDAEIAALRQERDAAHAHACENSLEERDLRAQVQAQAQTITRLREALEQIAAHDGERGCVGDDDTWERQPSPAEIATAALSVLSGDGRTAPEQEQERPKR